MSLKDQLMKAGFKPSVNTNVRTSKKPKNAIQRHQDEKNFCEHCEAIYPDVEKYNHKNPTTFAKWICAACADKLEILDRFRVTAQSEFSKCGRFRREYGETYVVKGGELVAPSDKKKGGGTRHNRGPNRGGQNRGGQRPGHGNRSKKTNFNK